MSLASYRAAPPSTGIIRNVPADEKVDSPTINKQERRVMETIIGIDLGTTNSEVAFDRDRQPQV